ncbi:DarT1-associated NADAR antitoxin family protein [Citrobacter arsenatis]|uniref:DarT1-associated NADAR antitoxin family protein n=1 Tax=Citrobacter arsenatis TaxID=2546350 RepID=UPI003D7FC35A
MAKRPVYIPTGDKRLNVRAESVDFIWFAGMSVKQKQKSIDSLHDAARCALPGISSILEISSKSREPLGIALSAFNLSFTTLKHQRTLTVECAFQGSKVFQNGGPYTDMFEMTSRDAKKDGRLTSSGRLIGFKFFGIAWELEPKTAFYDWLYISTLKKRSDLAEQIVEYDAFTDIEFNPERSINCQAYSAALYVSLHKLGLLDEAVSSKACFLDTIASMPISTAQQNAQVGFTF